MNMNVFMKFREIDIGQQQLSIELVIQESTEELGEMWLTMRCSKSSSHLTFT